MKYINKFCCESVKKIWAWYEKWTIMCQTLYVVVWKIALIQVYNFLGLKLSYWVEKMCDLWIWTIVSIESKKKYKISMRLNLGCEYSCIKKPWFRSTGNQHSGYGNRLWLAWLPFIRNRANVKPRAALQGVSRIYIGEISCILNNCQSVS